MEIDIDGVMKSMLLLKKKKYAALDAITELRQGSKNTLALLKDVEKYMKKLPEPDPVTI